MSERHADSTATAKEETGLTDRYNKCRQHNNESSVPNNIAQRQHIIEKSRGPKLEPRGTPEATSEMDDTEPPNGTSCFLFERYKENQFKTVPHKPTQSLRRRSRTE